MANGEIVWNIRPAEKHHVTKRPTRNKRISTRTVATTGDEGRLKNGGAKSDASDKANRKRMIASRCGTEWIIDEGNCSAVLDEN